MLEDDIEAKVQELERCDSRCTKLYNENCQLVRKMKTLEEHQEVLRVTIQDMEKLLTIKDSNSGNNIDNTKINVLIQTEGLGRPTTVEGMAQTESESKGKTYYESMFERIHNNLTYTTNSKNISEHKRAKCGYCHKNIPEHLQNINCDTCKTFFHVKCSRTTTQGYESWGCTKCLSKLFPFSEIDNDELFLEMENKSNLLNSTLFNRYFIKCQVKTLKQMNL